MATHHWMSSDRVNRVPVRRTRGRRGYDRRPNWEAVLVALAIIAWGWGAYELARLFLR